MRNAVLALALSACGLGGAPGGGLEELPTSGLGPYGKITDTGDTPAEEPFVIVDRTADLSDPTAIVRPFGGFRLWFTRAPTSGEPAAIYASDLDALTALPDGDPVLVLAADQPWEQPALRAPSAVVVDSDRVLLFYQGGTSIGRAESDDGGASFSKDPDPVLDGAADPGALLVGDTLYLYYARPDAPGIWVARSQDLGAHFTPVATPVLLPRGTTEGAFDRVWIGEPGPAGGITQAGQVRIVLFFTGLGADGNYALGSAASRDGLVFERFGDVPILEPGLKDERGAAPLLFPSQGILFFSQQRTRVSAIAVATSP